ncbi:uncharacterized protein SPPG_06358 [Spizellomyces punctatus DAOM BR117]|uniref:Rab-GAP TBC domain-containing protein n=1 Tax=Spizellomyces punctatus (strain DAOM BR117) TaxID=645134 RepID=A0A0L0HCQ0_SPIPD|nr:uncharacterized protein SPPG_06358 [Spizellomyces punctatus DAOM BR117]KNC98674.1 hypothetical protein SPPG_06358 [Spizellomyces punctatus DAOM BR117]|eukprot:XP_016606714.1 hypothetical protein SPPG_06358 [Spizellomyces punctatus DAOM BR117]
MEGRAEQNSCASFLLEDILLFTTAMGTAVDLHQSTSLFEEVKSFTAPLDVMTSDNGGNEGQSKAEGNSKEVMNSVPGSVVAEASKPAGPVIKPRTTSLKSQPEEPVRSTSPEPTSWTAFIRNRASLLGLGSSNDRKYDISSESDDDLGYPGLTSPSRRRHEKGNHTERILSDLDEESVEFLLSRLDIENQALALNPKTIYVEGGNIRGHQPTLQALTVSLTHYSTKPPGPAQEQDEADIDFWNSIIEDYASTLHKIPHLLTARVRAGIPPHLRAKIWTIMSGAQKDRFDSLYPLLLKQDSPFDRIIRRDIPRTFPKLDMFKEEGGEGQRKLYQLLKAYSIYDAEVGYCQGLSFVVGPLLMQDMSETEAFAVLVRLMEDKPPAAKSASNGNHHPHRAYALRTLFTPDMSGLHQMLYQHSELVREHLPDLYGHFQEHGVTATMYASQWFLTLYTYHFPLPLVFRIFDIIFAEGAVETMLRFSIAILKRNQLRLLEESEFENILEILKGDRLYEVYQDDPEAVVRDAMEVQDIVSERKLEGLRQSYTEEQRKRAATMSDAELVALQALIRQLRAETSRHQQSLTEMGRENDRLSKDNQNLRAKLVEAEKGIEEKEEECKQLRLRLKELESTVNPPQDSDVTNDAPIESSDSA